MVQFNFHIIRYDVYSKYSGFSAYNFESNSISTQDEMAMKLRYETPLTQSLHIPSSVESPMDPRFLFLNTRFTDSEY